MISSVTTPMDFSCSRITSSSTSTGVEIYTSVSRQVYSIKRRMDSDSSKDLPIVVPKRVKKPSFIVRSKEMKAFFGLLEDPHINGFIHADMCKLVTDKYLLAMVFAYFKRATYNIRHYNRTNFFVALYLASDMEEDEEEFKYEIFPWALGRNWRDKYMKFLRNRDKLWARIGHRAVVSSKCCEEIMTIEPGHWAWQRERPSHHGGAVRSYSRNSSDEDWYPRGPDASPKICKQCADLVQYDSASPDNTTWYLSSSTESSPDLINGSGAGRSLRLVEKDQRTFSMKGLKNTLEEDEGIWACVNEP